MRYKNSDNFEDYYKHQGREEDRLRYEDIVLEKIMFGLRTNGFKKSLLADINQKNLEYLLGNNFLKESDDKILL